MSAKITPQMHPKRKVLWEHIPLDTPWVIYIEPSGYCNLKCRFCPHGIDGGRLKKSMMTPAVFRKIIDDLQDFPERVKLLRICGNGEPLLNKYLVPMLQYARDRNAAEKVEMLSNGLLLDDNLIENLPRVLTRIIFSIEGLCADDYQRVSGARPDFQAFLKNLKALYAKRGQCVVHVKIHHAAVPTKEKEAAFFDLFADCCDEICIEKLVPMWPQCDSEYFVDAFRWQGAGVVRHRVCAQIFKGLQVQADGEVVPCCVDWKRINLLGDINASSLSEIWNGRELRELQIAHLSGDKSNREPCKDCTMNDYTELDNIDEHAEECLRRLRSLPAERPAWAIVATSDWTGPVGGVPLPS